MNTCKILKQTLVASLLVGAFSANAAVVYTFDATDVSAFGVGPYGTVTLTDTGSNIDVKVDLRSDLNFVNTGGPHSVFSFNLSGALTTEIVDIKFNGVAPAANTFTIESPGANQPFGTTFSFMLDCTGSACQNGAPGQSIDPLTFTVQNAEYSDFGFFAGTGNGATTAYFAADVICVETRCNGATGAIGVTNGGGGGGGTGSAPEPGSLALLGIGLAGLGVRLRRSRAS